MVVWNLHPAVIEYTKALVTRVLTRVRAAGVSSQHGLSKTSSAGDATLCELERGLGQDMASSVNAHAGYA